MSRSTTSELEISWPACWLKFIQHLWESFTHVLREGRVGVASNLLIRSCRLVLIVSGEPPCVLIRFLIALSRAENSMARNKIDEIAKLRKVVEQVRSEKSVYTFRFKNLQC